MFRKTTDYNPLFSYFYLKKKFSITFQFVDKKKKGKIYVYFFRPHTCFTLFFLMVSQGKKLYYLIFYFLRFWIQMATH